MSDKDLLIYQLQKTANGQIGYSSIGSGPALIMVVGYSGTLFHWNRYFVDKLAEKFTIYMIDNRKVGLSDSVNAHSMTGMAQDVVDFIEAKELKDVHLFGWSMGGVVCQTLLKYHSKLFVGAVLLATFPCHELVSGEFIHLVANSHNLPAHEYRNQLHAMFFSEAPHRELKEFITASTVKIKDYDYRYSAEAKELQDQVVMSWSGYNIHDFNNIKVPILLLRAKNDLVVDYRANEFMLEHLPHAKAITYSEGGHFFLHKEPVHVANDITNFFNKT